MLNTDRLRQRQTDFGLKEIRDDPDILKGVILELRRYDKAPLK
jgi:hypothetical protein